MKVSNLPEDQHSRIVDRLSWPLITLDFEASGLGEFTYPIEIGIARWASPDAWIETWSTLIKPPAKWIEHRIWNRASEAVHGIRLEDLEAGMSATQALQQANQMVGSHVAFCDGGEHDLRWLLHLAQEAGLPPTFKLADWDALGGGLSPEQYAQMIRWLDTEPVIHRAAADAERLLKAFAIGTGHNQEGSRVR